MSVVSGIEIGAYTTTITTVVLLVVAYNTTITTVVLLVQDYPSSNTCPGVTIATTSTTSDPSSWAHGKAFPPPLVGNTLLPGNVNIFKYYSSILKHNYNYCKTKHQTEFKVQGTC